MAPRYDAVVFDLLTALLDSWSLWNSIAGSAEEGMRWRREYLRLTYGEGRYRDYVDVVTESAENCALPASFGLELERRWSELTPWPEAKSVLDALGTRARIAVVTNCSNSLGLRAAQLVGVPFEVTVTAERAGFYKPSPVPYRLALEKLGIAPEQALFVAGSPNDIPGATGVGMDVFWHNRLALPLSPGGEGVPGKFIGSAPTLEPLRTLVA